MGHRFQQLFSFVLLRIYTIVIYWHSTLHSSCLQWPLRPKLHSISRLRFYFDDPVVMAGGEKHRPRFWWSAGIPFCDLGLNRLSGCLIKLSVNEFIRLPTNFTLLRSVTNYTPVLCHIYRQQWNYLLRIVHNVYITARLDTGFRSEEAKKGNMRSVERHGSIVSGRPWTLYCEPTGDQRLQDDTHNCKTRTGHRANSCRFGHFKLRILLEPVCWTWGIQGFPVCNSDYGGGRPVCARL